MSDKIKVVSINSKKDEPKESGVLADKTLDAAKGRFQDDMLIIGWGKDDSLTMLTPCRSKPELLYLLDMVKLSIMTGGFE